MRRFGGLGVTSYFSTLIAQHFKVPTRSWVTKIYFGPSIYFLWIIMPQLSNRPQRIIIENCERHFNEVLNIIIEQKSWNTAPDYCEGGEQEIFPDFSFNFLYHPSNLVACSKVKTKKCSISLTRMCMFRFRRHKLEQNLNNLSIKI